MFSGIEILYVILCVLFIFLVLLQNTSGNGLSNLSGGGASSSKSKRITGLTKFTAGVAVMLFSLTFYIAYDHKVEKNNFVIEEVKEKK